MSRKAIDEGLQEICEKCADDPLGFVMAMYPWGEGQLQDWKGPDKWHKEVLETIRAYLEGPDTMPLRIAVASGHGAAKTTLVAWLMHWFMSCRGHPQVVCTANTESQLITRTWRELAKWHKLASNRDWFDWTATSFYLKAHPETWKANAIPW